ncbi:MAG: hypothetical protein AABY53_03230 [Bdellovibrionota bacterium]
MNILHFLESSKKRQELILLSNSLSDFGLSPTEWCLMKEDCTSYKITNKIEPNFFFRGQIQFKNGRKRWGSIQLAGL